jgi:hypothetical protein
MLDLSVGNGGQIAEETHANSDTWRNDRGRRLAVKEAAAEKGIWSNKRVRAAPDKKVEVRMDRPEPEFCTRTGKDVLFAIDAASGVRS